MTKTEQAIVRPPVRVAIVHDWLVGGGAELVVQQLHTIYPEAPVFTSYCTDHWRKQLDNKVVTGWLQKLGRVRKFVPFLRIWWFTHLDLSSYDVVISSSGAEAKGIHTSPHTLHVNYCHAPTHYYWRRYEEYLAHPGFGYFDWLARLGLRLLVSPLRAWDYRAAQRPDYIIANSTHIQSDIKQYYNRESRVIHPPVTTDRFGHHTSQKSTDIHYIISGRQVPYKRFDIAIEACNKLGLPLTVIGTGPDNARLRKMAGPSITFLGRVSDKQLEEAFAKATALISPGTEDFCITAVEALASGTPVLAHRSGGALDYIIPGKTGEFFQDQTAEGLIATLKAFDPSRYNPTTISTYARGFSDAAFRAAFRGFIAGLPPRSS